MMVQGWVAQAEKSSLNEVKRQDQNSGILRWLESAWKANVEKKLNIEIE